MLPPVPADETQREGEEEEEEENFTMVDAAQCQIHLPGGPGLPLEESLGAHQHTAAPHQCCKGGSGWDHIGPLVLIKDCWCVKEVKKHHYGPQHGNFH